MVLFVLLMPQMKMICCFRDEIPKDRVDMYEFLKVLEFFFQREISYCLHVQTCWARASPSPGFLRVLLSGWIFFPK